LLGRLVGQAAAFVHVGELMFVWRRGVLENQLCGCGEPFRSCPFWTDVGAAAFGGWTESFAEESEDLRHLVERNRYLPALATGWGTRAFKTHRDEYGERLSKLYRSVAQVSGCSIIVDTSKIPAHALTLHGSGGIELRVCLLVRDSRGVAYSWTRRRRRPEIRDAGAYMDNYSTLRSTAEWVSFNSLFSMAGALEVPVRRVRYEDLVRRPNDELTALVNFAGGDPTGLATLEPGTVDLTPDHSMAGNPMRFTRGETVLAVDDEWRTAMPRSQRGVVTALTAPWLFRYGYLSRS
jgi:hypothetical protein